MSGWEILIVVAVLYAIANKAYLKVRKSDISIKLTKTKTKTLDSFKLNPFIIKIDCEGHELNVLKGMKKTDDHKKNISKTLSNTTKSKEHAAAISAAMKGNSNASK